MRLTPSPWIRTRVNKRTLNSTRFARTFVVDAKELDSHVEV